MCSSPFATSIERTRMGFWQVGQIQIGGGNEGSNSRGRGMAPLHGFAVGLHHYQTDASGQFTVEPLVPPACKKRPPRPPTEAAYAQSGHDAVSFGRSSGLDVILVNFILAPQCGQRGGAGDCSLTLSTTSGFYAGMAEARARRKWIDVKFSHHVLSLCILKLGHLRSQIGSRNEIQPLPFSNPATRGQPGQHRNVVLSELGRN
jgi:hypothetical protein